MANTSAPFGFMQDSGTGSTPTYEQVPRVAQYNAAAIYRGDPVTSQTDGTVALSSAGTTQIAGICQGSEYLSVSQQRKIWNNYWPGTDVASGQYATIWIVNDPNAQFIVQSGSVGLTLADVETNVQFNIGTPNAYTKQSGAYVESPAVTATLPFRVKGIVTTPASSFPNPEAGAYALAIVAFNNVDTKSLTGLA
jgi:hypothetical protein